MSAIVVDPPTADAVPLVVAVPHAGTSLPACLSPDMRLPAAALRPLEDPWVDHLFADVTALGAWRVATRWARAVVDVNRAPDEFADGQVPGFRATAKARAGLGVVPTLVGGRPIYASPLTPADIEARLALAHRPYHAALARVLAEVQARFGEVLLLDAHSMPANALPPAAAPVDVVLGDRYGGAAAPEVTTRVEAALRRAGLTVVRNHPYAGGFVTRHYGAPQRGVHVVQLEVRRALYMDEARFEPTAAFTTVTARLERALVDIIAGFGHTDGVDRAVRGRRAAAR